MTRYQITCGIGKDKDGNVILPKEATSAIQQLTIDACKRFGGVTVLRGNGAWRCEENGQIVSEPVAIFQIDAEQMKGTSAYLFAALVQRELKQQCVMMDRWEVSSQLI